MYPSAKFCLRNGHLILSIRIAICICQPNMVHIFPRASLPGWLWFYNFPLLYDRFLNLSGQRRKNKMSLHWLIAGLLHFIIQTMKTLGKLLDIMLWYIFFGLSINVSLLLELEQLESAPSLPLPLESSLSPDLEYELLDEESLSELSNDSSEEVRFLDHFIFFLLNIYAQNRQNCHCPMILLKRIISWIA